MSKVFCAHAVSVDGYISGRTPDGEEEFGRGLGDAPMLFDGFKLSEPSARLFDNIATQTLVTTGIGDAIDAARAAAGDQDVA